MKIDPAFDTPFYTAFLYCLFKLVLRYFLVAFFSTLAVGVAVVGAVVFSF